MRILSSKIATTAWDQTNAAAGMTFSNDDTRLEYEGPPAGWMLVRSTTAKMVGKWYFELRMFRNNANHGWISGVGDTATNAGYVGGDSKSIGLQPWVHASDQVGRMWRAGVQGPSFFDMTWSGFAGTTDVYGIAIELPTRVWFRNVTFNTGWSWTVHAPTTTLGVGDPDWPAGAGANLGDWRNALNPVDFTPPIYIMISLMRSVGTDANPAVGLITSPRGFSATYGATGPPPVGFRWWDDGGHAKLP